MSRASDRYDMRDLDDFEDLLPDRPHDEKWELIGGRVVKMTVGARWEHHRIIQNPNFGLSSRLKARSSSCRVSTETFFMKSKAVESATLPDLIVHCGKLPPGATSLDPVVLFEVVSRGSGSQDWTEKWPVYRRLPSLRHYVLVDLAVPIVAVYDRTSESWTSLRVLEALDAKLDLPALDLPALDLAIPMAEIYADVLSG